MNLLDEDFSDKKGKDTKKTIKIIVILIVVIVLCIIGIFAYMMYLESLNLKVLVNGQQNENVKDLIVTEADGTIYVPVRAISSYLGYTSYNGEYSNRSEDSSKCFVQCDGEAANLTLNSNKIYKLNLQNQSDNYTYIYIDKPVRAINGQLYITTDGMEKVFNTTFDYNTESNTMTIYTATYLAQQYATSILDLGYTKLSENFENYKAIVNDMLVVTDDQYYGVINTTDGSEILECKYDGIIYQEATNDFIVLSDEKYGIIGADKRTKIDINYDSIALMDYDAGLYLAERNDKYGVIDLNGNTIIYPENDQIGVDISRFEENDLKTGYILVDNLIPVMRDQKWGLFDKRGNQVVEFEYDSFGYIASSNREATNLLVIPSYNVIVACINERYTLLNASGEQPIRAFVDDIYMTINGGEKHYTMIANDRTYDVEEYLDRLGVQPAENNTSNSSRTTNTTNTNNTTNTTNETNTDQEDQQNNNEETTQNDEQNNEGTSQEEQQNNDEQQESTDQQGETTE